MAGIPQICGHDLNGPTAARPSNAERGQIFYDTTTNQFLYYDGTTWNVLMGTVNAGLTFNVSSGTITGSTLSLSDTISSLLLTGGQLSYGGQVFLPALPTIDPHVLNQLYNLAGVVKVSAG